MTSAAPLGAAEGTIIEVPGLGPSERLQVSDLVSIEPVVRGSAPARSA